MAVLDHNPEQYFSREVDQKSRVLLINPPVQERRYHWLRWNQPTELLRLSSWLRVKHAGIGVRLFDFMFPDSSGSVSKHKVKETWGGSETDSQLWHFGRRFEEFEEYVSGMLLDDWIPDAIVVSSLTSYWHVSIEKLLIKLCTRLGRRVRQAAKIILYGNYPRFEPEHAENQPDADVALTRTVQTTNLLPDFGLYIDAERRPPNFYGLDVESASLADHLDGCLEVQGGFDKARGLSRPGTITVSFLNDDICSSSSHLEDVVAFAQSHPKRFVIEGIAGIEPRSLSCERLLQLKNAGFRSLFVEHAREPGGDLDVAAYAPLLELLGEEAHERKSGRNSNAWLDRGRVTGFVAIGLPDDEMDKIVRSTLKINQFFQSIILKPYGYSPSIGRLSVEARRKRWRQPWQSSPQCFPYLGRESGLVQGDYENLLRWQNVLNKRVKGTTFDFLDDGNVARLVRETLMGESWKRQEDPK